MVCMSVKRNVDPLNEKDICWRKQDVPCAIEEFFRREQEKPWWLRSNACMLVCNCPKCTRQRGTL